MASCPRRAAAAPKIELPPFWEESKREVALPLQTSHHLCGWALWRNGPPFPGSAGIRKVHGRKAEEMARVPLCPSPPLSLPQEATCCGGRAWGQPAQQACGSCSKPLGRGLTSSRLCETPGGFLTSSNGRVGVGEASPKVPTSACTGPGPVLPPTCSPSPPPPPPTDSQEDTASVSNSWKAVQARSGAFC